MNSRELEKDEKIEYYMKKAINRNLYILRNCGDNLESERIEWRDEIDGMEDDGRMVRNQTLM